MPAELAASYAFWIVPDESVVARFADELGLYPDTLRLMGSISVNFVSKLAGKTCVR